MVQKESGYGISVIENTQTVHRKSFRNPGKIKARRAVVLDKSALALTIPSKELLYIFWPSTEGLILRQT